MQKYLNISTRKCAINYKQKLENNIYNKQTFCLSEILEFFKFLNCSYTRKEIVKSINVRPTASREMPICTREIAEYSFPNRRIQAIPN